MNRKFTERPIFFSLVVIAAAMPMIWLFLTPIARLVPHYFGETVKFLGTLLVVLGLCQECFGGPPFSLRRQGFFRGLFTVGVPGLILALAALIPGCHRPQVFPGAEVLLSFPVSCAAAAVSEEFLFRGLILSELKRRYPLRRAVLICSLLFGLRQLLNLFWEGSMPLSTVGQVFTACFFGIYLCAVYERTQNLWVCAAVHFSENFCAGFWSLFSIQAPADADISGVLILCGLHLICGLAGWQLLKAPKKA